MRAEFRGFEMVGRCRDKYRRGRTAGGGCPHVSSVGIGEGSCFHVDINP